MKKRKLVSVIIPTYNRPKSILDCIKSIRKQTYKNTEIIVIDDGSELPYKLPKDVKYFKLKKSRGVGAARNLGIKLSHGNIILFVDDDIRLKPRYIELLLTDLNKFKNRHVGAIAGRLVYPKKPNLGVKKGPLLKISKWTGNLILNASVDTKKPVFVETLHSCAVFPKEVFKDVGMWEETRYKGNYTYVEPDFYYRMRAKGWKLIFEPRAIAEHLQLSEGGCRGMPKYKYKWYTIRNAFYFIKRFYGWKVIYMWPLFVLSRLVKK